MGEVDTQLTRSWWKRHVHSWTTVSSNYCPPNPSLNLEIGSVKARGAGAQELLRNYFDTVDRAAHGFTTITQQCASCGKQESYTVLGKAG